MISSGSITRGYFILSIISHEFTESLYKDVKEEIQKETDIIQRLFMEEARMKE